MAPFLGFGGLAGFLVFTVLAVIHALKRTGRAKRLAFISAIAFGLFVVALNLPAPPDAALIETELPGAEQASPGLATSKGGTSGSSDSPIKLASTHVPTESKNSKDESSDTSLDAIKVAIDAQTMSNTRNQYKTVVYVENTSPQLNFVGTVCVISKDVDGRTLDSDTIFVGEDKAPLLPGQQTYAILWLKRGRPPAFARTITGRFMQPPKNVGEAKFTVEARQVGPGAATFWLSIPTTDDDALLAASRQILEQYSALRVITAYFYSDPEAARERTYDEKNHPFATLDMGQTYAPKLTFFDSNRTLLVR
jgi:hypothetical protein